ncbi:MAG: hypothetical protein ACRD9S_24640 [Pyrinomonadaceae bacterium]
MKVDRVRRNRQVHPGSGKTALRESKGTGDHKQGVPPVICTQESGTME